MNSSPQGFTLIEALIGVCLMALMALMAFHAPKPKGNSPEHILGELQSAIAYARAQAIARQCKIILQQRDGSWTNGYLVRSEMHLLKKYDPLPQGSGSLVLGKHLSLHEKLVFNQYGHLHTKRGHTFVYRFNAHSYFLIVKSTGQVYIQY